MTSNKGAGFKENNKKFDPLNQGSKLSVITEEKIQSSPEEQTKEMEKSVNFLLEESTRLYKDKKMNIALEKAKEALNKDKALRKLRETNNTIDQINMDLTFSVCLNLALMYEANNMLVEALNTYE